VQFRDRDEKEFSFQYKSDIGTASRPVGLGPGIEGDGSSTPPWITGGEGGGGRESCSKFGGDGRAQESQATQSGKRAGARPM
jgi:hypothetical protein